MMIRSNFCDRSGGGATKISRLVFGMAYSRDQELLFPDFRDRKTEARLSRPRQRRRDFPDQGGDGATFQTKAETASLSRSRRRRRDFQNQGGDGATFQNKAETARLSRPSRRRRDQKSIPRGPRQR